MSRVAALLFSAVLLQAQSGVQTFLQLSDPQFGMYAKNQGFAHETANFEFAIATANRLRPSFVVVTGDLTDQGSNAAEAAEYKRVAAKLGRAIPLFNVPGNHDVENEPTEESLARYRERFGRDYYSFHVSGITGIVLNSNLEKAPEKVPGEAARMEAWLQTELAKEKAAGAKRIIVFQHIPFFLRDPSEPDQYFNIPGPTRQRYLKLLHEYGVRQVFAGHYHGNSIGHDGDLEMVTTGAVGKPLDCTKTTSEQANCSDGGKSGLRIVRVSDDTVTHRFYELSELPEALETP